MGIRDGFLRLRRTATFLRRGARQARYPFRPWDEIRRDQAARLARTVAFAYARVPYYRAAMDRLGLTPAAIRTVEDLEALPLLDGGARNALGGEIRDENGDEAEWLPLSSGGSTGSPKTIPIDAESYLEGVALLGRFRPVLVRALGTAGPYREAFFAPDESTFRKNEGLVRKLLWAPRLGMARRRHFSLYDEPAEVLDELTAYRPDVLAGFGSYVGELLRLQLESGGRHPLPRVVLYSSEDLPHEIRRAAEERGVAVFSIYTAIEAIYLGFGCGEGEGVHVNEDFFPLRVIGDDGRTLPAGEPGSVVISNLANRATVLLNYRLGDRARLLPEPCPCGRSLPRIGGLEGRDDEWVALPGGGRTHSQAVRTLFTFDAGEVAWYRVIQERADRFAVTLMLLPGVDRASLTTSIVERFRDRFGAAVEVDVTFTDRPVRTEGGKLRTFFSRVRA